MAVQIPKAEPIVFASTVKGIAPHTVDAYSEEPILHKTSGTISTKHFSPSSHFGMSIEMTATSMRIMDDIIMNKILRPILSMPNPIKGHRQADIRNARVNNYAASSFEKFDLY